MPGKRIQPVGVDFVTLEAKEPGQLPASMHQPELPAGWELLNAEQAGRVLIGQGFVSYPEATNVSAVAESANALMKPEALNVCPMAPATL